MYCSNFAYMARYAHDYIVPKPGTSEEKKEQVAGMFDSIAVRYDVLNRFLSGGFDISWRKKAIAELRSLHPQHMLDVATGTADVALLMQKMLQPSSILGIDISEGMLEIGRKKIAEKKLEHIIRLETGNSEAINFADNTFDAITVAFGVRNFQHLDAGLSEMLRVLKTGGKLIVLEFSRPSNSVMKKLYSWYMKSVTPGVGKLVSGNGEAYSYLEQSVQLFPEREDFLNILSKNGFKNVYYKPLTLGICCIYGAEK